MAAAQLLAMVLLCNGLLACADEGSVAMDACEGDGCSHEDDAVAMLQTHLESQHRKRGRAAAGEKDLVLAHIPFNFGHTLEAKGLLREWNASDPANDFLATLLALHNEDFDYETKWAFVNKVKKPDAEIWGHMHPDLLEDSKVTGCPLYFTPGKHWPQEIARKYFGDKKIFGMLRDPYERMVALFRGNVKGYGGEYPEFFKTCNVDGAVRLMMERYLAGDMYAEGCTFVPQAEFFDPPFGVTVPVDNRRFPISMNEILHERGYGVDWHINQEEIAHVHGCPEIWAGDLSCETKALVYQVYKRDFELLCKHFGYCDFTENTCIKGVEEMCPSNLTAKREAATHCPI